VRPGKQAWDVFQEHVSRSYFANHCDCCGPHVSFIGFGLLFSCHREGLAGKSGRNAVSQTAISSGESLIDECLDIAKYWGFFKEPVFDSLGKDSLAVVIIFHISHCSPAKQMLCG
jgi:hypothetical protein